jgi:peptidoglycan L-alanyl-D-glutamate endopeptidase CwlK
MLGKTSRARLLTCHPDLIRFVSALADDVDAGLVPGVSDISVACGHRNKADQDREFAEGDSKLEWPKSKHNSLPSRAVDVWLYPVSWDDLRPWRALRAHALVVAARLGIKIRVISWDWPHFELVGS